MEGRDAAAQFAFLVWRLREGGDPREVVAANYTAVFLHYRFWELRDFSDAGVSEHERGRVLAAVQDAWSDAVAGIPLTIPGG